MNPRTAIDQNIHQSFGNELTGAFPTSELNITGLAAIDHLNSNDVIVINTQNGNRKLSILEVSRVGRSAVNDFRLTLHSKNPIMYSTREGSDANTLYFTPYTGTVVTLYQNNSWVPYKSGEIALPLAGTEANTTYDVFVTDSNDNLVLKLEKRTTPTGSIKGVTNGTTSFITPDTNAELVYRNIIVSTNHQLIICDRVILDGITGFDRQCNGPHAVLSVTTNSFTVTSPILSGTWGGAGTWKKANTNRVSLTKIDGVYVSSGDYSKRYVGVVHIGPVAGESGFRKQFAPFKNCKCLIKNINNLYHEVFFANYGYTSSGYIYSTAAWRPGANDGDNQFEYIHDESSQETVLLKPYNMHLETTMIVNWEDRLKNIAKWIETKLIHLPSATIGDVVNSNILYTYDVLPESNTNASIYRSLRVFERPGMRTTQGYGIQAAVDSTSTAYQKDAGIRGPEICTPAFMRVSLYY